MSQHVVTLLLGSNLGDTSKNVERAIRRIASEVGTVVGRSEIMQTEAVEFVSNNIFCNIALRIVTSLSPVSLLNSVKKIEYQMGRVEDSLATRKYVDRVIDIDIVRYGNINFSSLRLQIPHQKHLYERDFSRQLLSTISETLKTQI